MNDHFLLEKLQTRKGESNILIILLFAGIMVFVVMPVLAITFEKGLIRLATQEITDMIDLKAFGIYQEIDLEAFSDMTLEHKARILESMNENLNITHPQIELIVITGLFIEGKSKPVMTLEFDMIMKPTLYRSVYQLDLVYRLSHSVLLPIDGDVE